MLQSSSEQYFSSFSSKLSPLQRVSRDADSGRAHVVEKMAQDTLKQYIINWLAYLDNSRSLYCSVPLGSALGCNLMGYIDSLLTFLPIGPITFGLYFSDSRATFTRLVTNRRLFHRVACFLLDHICFSPKLL